MKKARVPKEDTLRKITEDRDYLLRQNEALRRDLNMRDANIRQLQEAVTQAKRDLDWHKQMNQTLSSKIPGAR